MHRKYVYIGGDMEREYSVVKWCMTVIQYVRCKSDRDEIYEELLAHMDDKMEALQEKGYTKEEAERIAVEAMGDAREVGLELDQQHSYVYEVLVKITKRLLYIVIPVVFVYCFLAIASNEEVFRTSKYQEFQEILNYYDTEQLIWSNELNVEGKLGEYKIGVNQIYAFQSEEDKVNLVLHIVTKFPFFRMWNPMNTLVDTKIILSGIETLDIWTSENERKYINSNLPVGRYLHLSEGNGTKEYALIIYNVTAKQREFILTYTNNGYNDSITIPMSQEGQR